MPVEIRSCYRMTAQNCDESYGQASLFFLAIAVVVIQIASDRQSRSVFDAIFVTLKFLSITE